MCEVDVHDVGVVVQEDLFFCGERGSQWGVSEWHRFCVLDGRKGGYKDVDTIGGVVNKCVDLGGGGECGE